MDQPLYQRIAQGIVDRIESGSYGLGEKIPSIRNLAAQTGVSVNTVREAYSLLERRRYIQCRPQAGYFVARRPPPLPTERVKGDAGKLDPLEVSICRIYSELRLSKGDSGAASLSIAVPDAKLLPSRRLASSLRALAAGLATREGADALMEYMITPGHAPLRREIAHAMTFSGCALGPDDLIVTSGASEAVSLSLMALCERGDSIAVESPIYFNFLSLAKELGLKVLEIPSSPTEGMHVEALRFALAYHKPKACLCIPNFSNPSGSLMPLEAKRELTQLCAEAGVALIEDDVHGDLAFQWPRPPSLKSMDDAGNVIYCSSFSKTLGAGLRIGWIAPGRHKERIERLKLLSSVGTASLTQLCAAALLEKNGYERHVRSLSRALESNISSMSDLVAASFPEGTRLARPKGGLLLWIELPKGLSALELYAACAKESILFPPGPVFSPSRAFESCLRLNAGVWNPGIEAAVRRIGEIAKAL
jgi:DNA-binding transcriptional MocR family regulator